MAGEIYYDKLISVFESFRCSSHHFNNLLIMSSKTRISDLGKGRKRSLNDPKKCAKNVKKKLRNSGEEYYFQSSDKSELKLVPEKVLKIVTECCRKTKCYSKISIQQQQFSFEEFWGFGDYDKQNIYLKSMMRCKESKNIKGKSQNRLTQWFYFLSTVDTSTAVCREFLLNLFNISVKRLRTIQDKVKFRKDICDQRGNYLHKKKLIDDVKKLIVAHLESFNFYHSYYRRQNSDMLYFEDSQLNVKKLYDSFLDFYQAVTEKEEPPISEATYTKYFNHNLNLSFSSPKSDVCNFCFETKKKSKLSSSFGTLRRGQTIQEFEKQTSCQ